MPEKGSLLRFFMHPTVLIYSLSVFTSFNYIGFNQATLEPHIREVIHFSLFIIFAFNITAAVINVTQFKPE